VAPSRQQQQQQHPLARLVVPATKQQPANQVELLQSKQQPPSPLRRILNLSCGKLSIASSSQALLISLIQRLKLPLLLPQPPAVAAAGVRRRLALVLQTR
jgi:hypothetical protein